MEQAGHTDPSLTLGVYARAVRNGRRSARSRRRPESLAGEPLAAELDAVTGADRALTGTGRPDEVETAGTEVTT